jgi:hypothetical protein
MIIVNGVLWSWLFVYSTTHVRGVPSVFSFWWQHNVSLRQNMICFWADVITFSLSSSIRRRWIWWEIIEQKRKLRFIRFNTRHILPEDMNEQKWISLIPFCFVYHTMLKVNSCCMKLICQLLYKSFVIPLEKVYLTNSIMSYQWSTLEVFS